MLQTKFDFNISVQTTIIPNPEGHFGGRFPYPSTNIWGDQPAGKGRDEICPVNTFLMTKCTKTFVKAITHSLTFQAQPTKNHMSAQKSTKTIWYLNQSN